MELAPKTFSSKATKLALQTIYNVRIFLIFFNLIIFHCIRTYELIVKKTLNVVTKIHNGKNKRDIAVRKE